MTRIVLVAIACDLCAAVCDESARPTIREARAIAKARGWIKSGRVRRCPTCIRPKPAASTQPAEASN